MTHDLVTELLKYVIAKLNQSKELQKYSHGVYTYVPNNVESPYIFINKTVSKDWSSKTFHGLEVEIGLAAITRETSLITVLTISKLINEIIQVKNEVLEQLVIISGSFVNSSINYRPNTQTFQINNTFKFTVQEK